MRKPTKVALSNLAEQMVENGSYINTKGTVDFINEAIKLHKKADSFVTPDTIRRHESELEQMCQQEMLKRYPLKKDVVVPKQFDDDIDDDIFEDENFYWACGDMVDDDAIIRRAIKLQLARLDDSSKASSSDDEFFELELEEQLIPQGKNYTMFFEGEDGLRVKRGKYKGLYIPQIDAQTWKGCAANWSRYQLKNNQGLGEDRPNALTEDDKKAFLDIIDGKDV